MAIPQLPLYVAASSQPCAESINCMSRIWAISGWVDVGVVPVSRVEICPIAVPGKMGRKVVVLIGVLVGKTLAVVCPDCIGVAVGKFLSRHPTKMARRGVIRINRLMMHLSILGLKTVDPFV